MADLAIIEPTSRYEIVDYKDIPVADIFSNPANPRPKFHLADDDPELIAMGQNILTEGQHRPILVYELVGHFTHPDQPNKYMLLQGERRWRSSQLVGVETLKANVHKVPVDTSQELELLGIEEAHKLSWQPFFEMKHAALLAESYGLPIDHADIANKTGLSREQLRTATKIFSLCPEVQALVEAYEEEMYQQKLLSSRRRRIQGQNRKQREFTPTKAALVYDIFVALREKCTLSVAKYDDIELQVRIAAWSTQGGADTDKLRQIHSSLNQMGAATPPGMLATIHNMLSNPQASINNAVATLGSSHFTRLTSFVETLEKKNNTAERLAKGADQFGDDPHILNQVRLQLSECIRHYEKLERSIADRVKELS